MRVSAIGATKVLLRVDISGPLGSIVPNVCSNDNLFPLFIWVELNVAQVQHSLQVSNYRKSKWIGGPAQAPDIAPLICC